MPEGGFLLLAALLSVLWIAGGASRPDTLGQVVVRAVAWVVVVIAILSAERPFPPRPGTRPGPVALFLLLALLLAGLQLIPLPPDVWQSLPGRERVVQLAALAGYSQPWRPWSMVPDATLNALASLVVPGATFVLATMLEDADRRRLTGFLLSLVFAAMLLGVLQLSGAAFDNPLVNASPLHVSSIFANRNHFALFLAMGCLLAPVWAFTGTWPARGRGPIALGATVLFALMILAIGSRAGIVLGGIALVLGPMLVRHEIARSMRHYPRWVPLALIGGTVAVVAIAVLGSIAADRAVSIDRVLAIDPGQDMRGRGLPVVLTMIREYFPAGTGLGGFDPIFRSHEPFDLLKPTYFNHAHNDLVEVVLDTGLPGLLLLAAALGWWAWASVGAWRGKGAGDGALGRLGSAVLLLLIVASAFDYPARTPLMMAVIVVAAVWLDGAKGRRGASALPHDEVRL